MKTRVARAQICLEPRQHRRLKALSRETGKPISRIVRECLDKALGRGPSRGRRDPLDAVVGMCEGTGENVSERHDRYLYGPRL